VLVDVEDEEVDAWAVGRRGELVFVRRHETRGHNTTAWVAACSVPGDLVALGHGAS
jgi:hypothetical protein